MKLFPRAWALGLVVGVCAASALAAPVQSNVPSKIRRSVGAPDLAGQTRRPLEDARRQGKAATLLIFVTTDCPISNRAAPEINRIAREYGQRNIACYVVQTDRELSIAEAKSHAKQFGTPCPVLLDRKHDLVRLAGAHVTPEAAVISPTGQVLYRGRIDDTYASLSRPRLKPTRRDLRLALDAVCAGKSVAVPRTTALGCYIEG